MDWKREEMQMRRPVKNAHDSATVETRGHKNRVEEHELQSQRKCGGWAETRPHC